MTAWVHPLAVIDEAVLLGGGTKIWQFASVLRNAKIGRWCTVAAYALVDAATVGDNCIISSGAQLHPGTKVGSACFIGPCAIFCNDAWPRVSKDGFDASALLTGTVTTVELADGANIGAGAIVLPGVRIGKGAFIAAGSTVERSVPPAHLHKRSGEIVPISPRVPERMLEAGCLS